MSRSRVGRALPATHACVLLPRLPATSMSTRRFGVAAELQKSALGDAWCRSWVQAAMNRSQLDNHGIDEGAAALGGIH